MIKTNTEQCKSNSVCVKTDCFGYDKEKKDCKVMTELLCAKKKCSFYKPGKK